MGLEGVGGGEDEVQAFAAGDLAERMENVGTLVQNAAVLNLFLAGANLLIGGPPPISQARTTEPVSSIVFNSNYTRERYGRSAVNDNISLDTDKKSLLLDDNQTSAQKALAFIASLEFANGLRVLQNELSNGDVTGQTQPDLDKFDRYPESMFNNASLLNDSKETFVFDAINASQDATDALASFEE
jgi:hypothetical protein